MTVARAVVGPETRSFALTAMALVRSAPLAVVLKVSEALAVALQLPSICFSAAAACTNAAYLRLTNGLYVGVTTRQLTPNIAD